MRQIAVFDLEWVPAEPFCPQYQQDDKRVNPCKLVEDHTGPCEFSDKIPSSPPLKLRAAGFYDGVSYQDFATMDGLLDHMLQGKYSGWWIYAHAGGLADVHFVFDNLLDRIRNKKQEYQIKASFSGSSAIIITLKLGKRRWYFIDSYWLLRDKLASIGKHLGMLKLGEEKRQTAKEARDFYANAPLSELLPYLRQDCEILQTAISKFEEYVLSIGGELKMTIASTGMTLFRRAFLNRSVATSPWINDIARKAYFASRVEVISRHATDFKTYDINSSFPYAMTFPQPADFIGMSTCIPDDENSIFIADVTIQVPDMHLPPVPYRHENRVFFPVGTWRTYLSSVDVYLAMKHGCKIIKVHSVQLFEPCNDLKEYANVIYKKRSDSESSYEKLVLKYLLNSLYGKFAEGSEKQQLLINPESVDRATARMVQPGVWLDTHTADIQHVHVPFSMHITAIARRTLYEYAVECYRQGKPSHYFDTDCLATSADLPTDEKTLGALKLEKRFDWGEFVLPKIYRGEGFELKKDGTWEPTRVERAKGFSLGRKDESWERLDRIINGKPIGIQRMIRVKESLRRMDSAGNPVTDPVEVRLFKKLAYESLTKRHHYPDGETRPWNINEVVSGNVFKPRYADDELREHLIRMSGGVTVGNAA